MFSWANEERDQALYRLIRTRGSCKEYYSPNFSLVWYYYYLSYEIKVANNFVSFLVLKLKLQTIWVLIQRELRLGEEWTTAARHVVFLQRLSWQLKTALSFNCSIAQILIWKPHLLQSFAQILNNGVDVLTKNYASQISVETHGVTAYVRADWNQKNLSKHFQN